MKTCKVCGSSGESGFHGRLCRDCKKRSDAEHYVENKAHILARNARWREKNAQPGSPYRVRQRQLLDARNAAYRQQVLDHYGGVCACCGETEPLFLTIDHINGGGRAHRASIRRLDIAFWLVREGFPDGFQLLCLNCNFGKWRNKGFCPHQAVEEQNYQPRRRSTRSIAS